MVPKDDLKSITFYKLIWSLTLIYTLYCFNVKYIFAQIEESIWMGKILNKTLI